MAGFGGTAGRGGVKTMGEAQPNGLGPSRRFVAKARWQRRQATWFFGGSVFLASSLMGLGSMLHNGVVTSLGLLFPLAYLALSFLREFGQRIQLEISGERVVIEGRQPRVFPLAGAMLG